MTAPARVVAVVTADDEHRLRPGSVIRVAGVERPIPEHCPEHHFIIAVHRILEVLAEMGWRPVLPPGRWSRTQEGYRFAVEPLTEVVNL